MKRQISYLIVALFLVVAMPTYAQGVAEEPATGNAVCECEADSSGYVAVHESICPYNSDMKRELWWRRATSDIFKLDAEGNFVLDTALDGWGSLPASIISLITILASVVTILGFTELLRNIYKGRVGRRCQKLIIVDLVRHFAINLTILQGIRLRMKEGKRPEEGTFLRFATLEADVDLGSFSVTANNYETIHELSLFMRNFNLMTEVVERHFAEAESVADNRLLLDDVDNLDQRMHKIIKRLWLMQVSLGYGIMEERVAHHFISQYGDYPEVDAKLYPSLADIEIPLFWSDDDIEEFRVANRANHIFTANILQSVIRPLALLLHALLALGEYLFMGFNRATFYEYGSRFRRPKGWRNPATKSKFADVYRRCIAKRMTDINYY